ncbi:hypothetical protein KKD52_04050 [Myxococcota bacterium]|nr:hypothetical protein [Myxococcota bacterium]MBU1411389.1 hypothetical protein [Myxococcota bacterium]MBU1509514.1 hypothetical protein [Myxococcota bacterium]
MHNSVVHLLRRCTVLITVFLLLATAVPSPARGNTFPAGSLIIPMNLTYQDHGMLQAYGLVAMLLRHGIPVYWVIAENKRYSASIDFTVIPRVLYADSRLNVPGDVLPAVHYRSGPFVIDATDAERALEVIKAWNEPRRWSANPWAARSVFQVVSVHEATLPFDGHVARTLIHAPRPAILADSREAEYARILRAAGIFQSDGTEFSDAPCQPGECGPGTARPEFLPVTALMGDDTPCFVNRGTSPGPQYAGTTLFDAQQRPRYALVAAAGWTVEDRETIVCEGGICRNADSSEATSPWVCFDPPLAVHGHRIVNYLTAFNRALGGLFFMGEAAYALENAVADPSSPVFDLDPIGHFVTRVPPITPCPCGDAGTVCFPEGCHNTYGEAIDCCLFPFAPARGAGIVPGGRSVHSLSIMEASYPPFQIDGTFHPSTGPLGLFSPVMPDGTPVVMTPDYSIADGSTPGVLATERLQLLADFRPAVEVPISSNPDTQVSRLFLNALFASEWARDYDPVAMKVLPSRTCFGPSDVLIYQINFTIQTGTRPLLEEVTLEVGVPKGIAVQSCYPVPETITPTVKWRTTAVTGQDLFSCVFTHQAPGQERLELDLQYRDAGLALQFHDTFTLDVTRSPDTDGDGLIDCMDPRPTVPSACGDANGDWIDDCSGDFLDVEDEGCCDCGDDYSENKDDPLGFPCTAAAGRRVRPRAGISALLLLLGLLALRRRKQNRGKTLR